MHQAAVTKVLLVSSVYPPYVNGGGAVSVKSLADRLAARGDVQVQVLSMADSSSEDRVDQVPVHRIAARNLYWSYRSSRTPVWKKPLWHLIETANPRMRSVANLIQSHFHPDVVHFRNIEDFSPSLFYFLAKRKIPTVHTLNSYSMIEPLATMHRESPRARKILKLSELAFRPKRFFSQWCRAVVGVSDFTLQAHLSRGYYRKSLPFVVHTTTEVALEASANDPSKDEITGGVTVAQPIRFGFLGNFYSEKGIAELITAFRRMPHQAATLTLAGDCTGDYGVHCQQLAGDDSRIHFLGRSDANQFLSLVDVLVIPSIWPEPYPRVLVEAQARLVPVIASANGGTREGIRQNEDGYVYQDEASLLGMLQTVSENSGIVKKWRKALREKLAFKTKTEDDLYVDIYHQIIARESRKP